MRFDSIVNRHFRGLLQYFALLAFWGEDSRSVLRHGVGPARNGQESRRKCWVGSVGDWMAYYG